MGRPNTEERPINVSMILAERIVALFDEVGASEAERYCAIQMATAMIPISISEVSERSKSATSEFEL